MAYGASEITHREVWEYLRHRVKSSDAAREYLSIKLYNRLMCQGKIPPDAPYNTDMFEGWDEFIKLEKKFEKLGAQMVARPRNMQFPPKLPGNMALLAIAYGTGKDDYLAIVLGFDPELGKLVTWLANFDIGPSLDGSVGCGNGNYFDFREFKDGSLGAIKQAWNDFNKRALELVVNAVRWK